MTRSRVTPRRSLTVAICVFVVLALVPSRYTGFVRWIGEPALVALAPSSRVFALVASWVRPTTIASLSSDEALRQVEIDRDLYLARWRQAQHRIAQLEALNRELQQGRSLSPTLDITPIAAPIVGQSSGPGSGVLFARAGQDRGVTINTVAVKSGVHLVGRVVDSGNRVCSILPITHRSTGWLRAVIDTDAGDGAALPGCQLRPTGLGQLKGEIDADAGEIEPGQRVRLLDNTWPPSAQMLVLGRVVSVDRKDDQPLRRVVTVQPELDPTRVADVVLLTTPGGVSATPEETLP